MNIIHRFVCNSEIRPIETPPACQADAGSLWLRPSTVSAQRRNSIKNRVLAELACVVFLLSSISFSQKVVTATANIPFEFWAVGQKFAAGEYFFDSGFPGSTSIHREGTKSTVAVPIIPYGDPVKKEDARVVFVLRDGQILPGGVLGCLGPTSGHHRIRASRTNKYRRASSTAHLSVDCAVIRKISAPFCAYVSAGVLFTVKYRKYRRSALLVSGLG
jgi:hypothetical protein